MIRSIIITSILLCISFLVTAQSFSVVDHKLEIEGTSSLHDWVSKANNLSATGDIKAVDGMLTGIDNLKVKVEVEEIESPKGRIMDNKTYKALESKDHPYITYELTDVKSIDKSASGYSIVTVGKLTIAGTTRNIEMTTDATIQDNNTLKFQGTYPMKMTSFDIDPPTAMLGALKTGDDVTIKYELTVRSEDLFAQQ